jgi:hypothetical protein
MKNLVKRLQKRGWKSQEIEKAVGIIQKAKQNKTKDNLFLEKRVYWVLIAVIVAANFSIALAMMPLLVALKAPALYTIMIILGIVFGLLFELVIRSMEHLKKKHHIALGLIIPIIALASAFFISRTSNSIGSAFGINNFHQPAVVGIVYAASFAAPYIFCRFVLKKEYYLE